MSLNRIFYISDFHKSKIVNNMFFLIFEGGLIFLSRSVYDKKLSFIFYIKNLKTKCNKALQLSRVVAHRDWGANQLTLMEFHPFLSYANKKTQYLKKSCTNVSQI